MFSLEIDTRSVIHLHGLSFMSNGSQLSKEIGRLVYRYTSTGRGGGVKKNEDLFRIFSYVGMLHIMQDPIFV